MQIPELDYDAYCKQTILNISQYIQSTTESRSVTPKLNVTNQILKPREINKFTNKIFKMLKNDSEKEFTNTSLNKLMALISAIYIQKSKFDADFSLKDLKNIILQRESDEVVLSKNSLTSYFLMRYTDKNLGLNQNSATKDRGYDLTDLDLTSEIRKQITDDVYEIEPARIDPSEYLNKVEDLKKNFKKASTFSQFKNERTPHLA